MLAMDKKCVETDVGGGGTGPTIRKHGEGW